MTTRRDRIWLARHVLDHQLVDSRGERCGKVDDVLLMRNGETGDVEVAAILAGPGVLARRTRIRALRWLVGLAGDEQTSVGWLHVSQVEDHVTLAMPAPDLGLARGEQRAASVLGRILGPDAHPVRLGPDLVARSPDPDPAGIRLGELLGRPAVDPDGRELGVVRELHAAKRGRLLGEAAGAAWVVDGVVLGGAGLRTRLGMMRTNPRVLGLASLPDGDGPVRVAAGELAGPDA